MTRRNKALRTLTSLALTLMVIFSVFMYSLSASGTTYYGSSPSIQKLNGNIDLGTEKLYDASVIYKLPDGIKDTDEISVIIQTKAESLLDAYDKSGSDLSFSEYVLTDEAAAVRENINAASVAVQDKMYVFSYTVGKTYDTLVSGFEVVIKAGDFNELCYTLQGQANVYISEVYNTAETQLVENKVNVYDTGIFSSQEFNDKYGIDGTGIVVAVLDTGIDYYHSAFSDSTFLTDRSKLGLTFDEVKAIMAGNDMKSEGMVSGLTAEDVYVSDKIPYAFDYADRDSDVFPLLSNHGTHVSGVIAGNHLDHISAEDYSGEFIGVAPNAQLVEMKIFSDLEATSHASWILAALEDCVTLGVDVINMSIGTACGFTRETDKEFESGVYERIRERGISLVVAASNSFNSAYGSEKNGNLPLTSNPDTATVGSPSTYLGAISVASIEGAKTPYLLYNNTIMYFLESNNRVSKEKNFVNELLGDNVNEMEIEYVLIAGAGSSAADYAGLDVKGKIALIKRGYNTFEEKAALAQEMGAIGVIIYNNVSGDIKMNVGETSIAVCSISQNDGEMLAAAGSGKIKISRSQTSGPFMSDFSSWGPTPDLKIKPEITAHGGAILSAVPGESYDRISGTSMATPNIAGVSALLRQYVIEKFGLDGDKDAREITATVNKLMMSTADIIINKNGLPYSVRKQGAGLANLLDSAATNAYIVTYNEDGSIMDKPKIELGDDPAKTGVYTLNFGVYNFGSSSISYDLSYHVFTEGVSETKTSHGETTVTETAYALNGAGIVVNSVNGGSISGSTVTVPAGSTAKISVTITLTEENKKYLNDSFENGMYVEGYVMLKAHNGEQDLNVPYLGFYGDWTQAPLFDLDYFETNRDELDDSIDPLDKNLADAFATRPVGGATDDYVSYLGSYYFEQNPQNKIIAADRKYIAISNQNANGEINSLRFVWAGMLRGAEKIMVTIVEDSTGEVVFETTENYIRKSYGDGGPIRPANIDIEFSAIDLNLKNNTSYTVTLKGLLHYGDGGEDTNLNNTFTFPLVTDFSAPTLSDCEFYTEYDRSTKKTRLFARMAIYDNHYAMALQAGYVGVGTDGMIFNSFDKYATPIYSDFNSTSYVTYELTDYVDDIVNGSLNSNTFTIVCYDYAMNSATYEIALPDDYQAFYFAEDQITLSPYEVYDLNPIVYPENQWGQLITYQSNNYNVVTVVNGKLVATGSGGATVTATAANGKKATFNVKVLSPGDTGYQEFSKPVAESFSLTGFYVNKAFYMIDSSARDIGSTGDEVKFGSTSYYSLSMYPSESVTLKYELDAYFPGATEVIFESGNTNIVTINSVTGQITAIAEGLASVTAKVKMDGQDTLFSATVNIEVKEPYITSGPSLSNYYGAGDGANHVTFPKDLAITEIGSFAFSNSQYVAKGPEDEISDEAPETMKLTYIGDNTIKIVTIPEGVERIGAYAFAGMTALEKVILPSTLETIDYGAFFGCTSLKVVEGIENVKFVNQGAFQYCALAGELNLDNAVAIANYAFANTNITSLNLPATLQSLGAYAFKSNTKLATVTIDAEKIKIGQYAFENCSSLKSIAINASVIPAGTFYRCSALTNVTIGKDVSVIGEYAFLDTAISNFDVASENKTFISRNNGAYLTDITGTKLLLVAPTTKSFELYDDNITTVGNGAFSGCLHITSVTIPSVTVVENFAFSECNILNSVNLGDLTAIGSYAFEKTAVDSFRFKSGVSIGERAFAQSAIKSVVIGNGITIPDECFYGCDKLTSVTLGDNVTVGKYAFFNNSYTSDFYYVDRDVKNSVTGAIVSQRFPIYYLVFTGPITSLTIGDNVVLEEGAFYGAANLTEVTLGKNAVIGDYAFYNCSSLNKVINLDKATVIGESAFSGDIYYEYTSDSLSYPDITEKGEYSYRYYSSKLESVDLSGLTELGKNAFALCKELKSVKLGKNLSVLPEGAFQYCDLLTQVNLDYVTQVGAYIFAECDLATVNAPKIEFIGEYAFCYNENLTSAILGGASLRIEEGAFSFCKQLGTLEGEENAFFIGDYAFAYTALKGADLSSAEHIGTHAFYMEFFTNFDVKITEVLKEIGDNPFANCSIAPMYSYEQEMFNGQLISTNIVYTFDLNENIKIIDGSIYKVVPKGLELICWMGDSKAIVADNTVRITAMAFAGSDVQMVVLPNTLLSIGHKAFYDCQDLVFVSFTGYKAPILEEEYDQTYYASMDNIPAVGNYDFPDYYGFTEYKDGIEIVPYFMWNVTSLPSNFYYGATFVDYVGHVENKITIIRPSNGKYYDSFIMDQYFGITINGATAADDITLAAIAAIGRIPQDAKDVKLEHKALILAAREAYDKITSYDQRALISNDLLAILTAAEQKIKNLEAVPEIIVPETIVDVVEKLNPNVIANIIIAVIFGLIVVAFIIVLVIFIKTMKKMTVLSKIAAKVREDEKKQRKANNKPGQKLPEVTKDDIIEKSEPVDKLKKSPFVKIEELIEQQSAKGKNKRMVIILVSCAVVIALMAAGIVYAVTREVKGPFSEYEAQGFTVSVTFDPNGGNFKGSDSTIIDLYRVDSFGENGIKLLSPDDPTRDKNNALTISKTGYFLAGWYQTRTPIDENDLSKGYTYSGKWDFDVNTLNIEQGYDYSADESVLTLYAAWVPYYNYEIYTKGENGEDVLLSTVSAINLTIPQWSTGNVTLDMGNFPVRDGYTLDKVYYYDTMSEVEPILSTDGKKMIITGAWDEETATSLTPTIKLYTTWQEGEIYKIYSAKDLSANADPNGYYQIMADLDFTNTKWPAAFTEKEFNGKIFGNGHTIKGISIESNSINRTDNGIFASLGANAYIEDITFENVTHTIDLMAVKNGSTFGLLTGNVSGNAKFNNVQISGKLLIGDNCAELATTDAIFTIGQLAASGNVNGITSDITVEKVNPDNNTFELEITNDGTVTILPGNN